MLRRTFFKLLAALPFVGKAKPANPNAWIWEVKPSGEPLTLAAIERWHNEYRSLQTWNRRHHAVITNIKEI